MKGINKARAGVFRGLKKTVFDASQQILFRILNPISWIFNVKLIPHTVVATI